MQSLLLLGVSTGAVTAVAAARAASSSCVAPAEACATAQPSVSVPLGLATRRIASVRRRRRRSEARSQRSLSHKTTCLRRRTALPLRTRGRLLCVVSHLFRWGLLREGRTSQRASPSLPFAQRLQTERVRLLGAAAMAAEVEGGMEGPQDPPSAPETRLRLRMPRPRSCSDDPWAAMTGWLTRACERVRAMPAAPASAGARHGAASSAARQP